MRDLFSGAPKINGHAYLKPIEDPFRWIVARFAQDGATQVIQRANKCNLATYFPIRRNLQGGYVPMWRDYLFSEHREGVTINLCRTTSNFIKIVSERDQDGLVRPILVRREAINQSLRLITQGKFDDVEFKRKFHGRGTIVRIIDGAMADKTVKLDMDITTEMGGSTKVLIDINGVRARIELFKLAL